MHEGGAAVQTEHWIASLDFLFCCHLRILTKSIHMLTHMQLDSWSSSSSDGKYRLELPVPAGELELGKLLIQGMYCAQVDLSGLNQQQLLQLLLLADR